MREGMERARMGDEDICVGVNGGDENRLALAQKDADAVQQQEQWQLFYDETSYDQPVPWWFNPVTGESAWECPTTTTTTQRIPAALTAFPSGHAAGVGGDSHDDQYFETEATTSTLSQEYGDSDTCPQHTSLVGANQTLQGGAWRSQQAEYSHDTSALAASTADVGARTEPELALSVWTPYWSEEFQAYYYINEVTQESAWDLRPEAADSTVPTVPEAEGSDAERNEGETFQRQDGIMIETAPITRTGDKGAGEGVARGSGGNADARYGAEETQGAGGVAYESKLEQGVEDQAEQGLVLAYPPGGVDRSSGYPYFVNERGNRVFCVQRRTA